MDPKSKKVLEKQGTSVVQAVKWIGSAIFGDGEDVLDDIAECGDEQRRERTERSISPRASEPRRITAQRRRPKLPPPEHFIDVEEFVDDDEENE